ncbi:MAG: D-serine ammonia-lyase [Bacillota bacterium]|nr:D-serine ammonia-lyase [Bacillota bacterium]
MKNTIMSGEGLWINKKCNDTKAKKLMPNIAEIAEEYKRLAEQIGVFPTSDLVEMETFQIASSRVFAGSLPGRWFAKMDQTLPISGSVKIRGALYEILKYAEGLSSGNLSEKQAFQGKTISVASTGNLGLSVGLIARRMGFYVKVYMSKEAVEWKKHLLKENGADVILVDGDYTEAVDLCRRDSEREGFYFVDDERSELLYKGYAVAAYEIAENPVVKSGKAPIFVYLPCGVGNAPSGIAAGLKALLGNRVHIFLAEPVQVPSVLVGMSSGKYDAVSVYDFGRSGMTVADGLACARMAGRTAEILDVCISGIYTVEDDKMLGLLKLVGECEGIRIEPSAAAALQGMGMIYYTGEGIGYLRDRKIIADMDQSVHISWLTGGGMMPEDEYQKMYKLGEEKEKLLCDFL